MRNLRLYAAENGVLVRDGLDAGCVEGTLDID